MADNYLERKMEDLRSGRLGNDIRKAASPGPRKGVIQVAFPPRRVLVTGGCNGIGRAVARAFLKAGCKVAVMDCDKAAGEAMAAAEGIRFYHTDLADTAAIEKGMENLFSAWKDLDIVVNNAGISRFIPLTEGTADDFDHILAVNLRPAYVIARLWAQHRERYPFPDSYGGRMVNISSTRHMMSESGTEGYSASKGGMASLTHALMMSLSPFGITVNCISPGWICTEGDVSAEEAGQHPSRRVGRPDDVARLCVFLSLPGNDFINGADIPVDGGMTRKMIYD